MGLGTGAKGMDGDMRDPNPNTIQITLPKKDPLRRCFLWATSPKNSGNSDGNKDGDGAINNVRRKQTKHKKMEIKGPKRNKQTD